MTKITRCRLLRQRVFVNFEFIGFGNHLGYSFVALLDIRIEQNIQYCVDFFKQ